jgi:hypothetical protein
LSSCASSTTVANTASCRLLYISDILSSRWCFADRSLLCSGPVPVRGAKQARRPKHIYLASACSCAQRARSYGCALPRSATPAQVPLPMRRTSDQVVSGARQVSDIWKPIRRSHTKLESVELRRVSRRICLPEHLNCGTR